MASTSGSTLTYGTGSVLKPGDIVLALVVITLWGGNFVAMRFGAQALPPYLLLGLRLATASVALVWFAKSPRGMVVPLMLISTTLCTLHFGLALVGVQYIEAGAGALAMQTSVPFAALLAWLLFRESFGWRRWSGLIIAFTGIAIISGMPQIGAQPGMFLIMIVSAFFFAVATIQIKRLGQVDYMSVNAWITLFGAPQAFLVSWMFETGQAQALSEASLSVYGAFLYMALFAGVIGQGLWYRLVQRYQTNQVMPFTILVPVMAVVFGILILGEALTWQLALGGAITISGVAIIVLRGPDIIAAEIAGSRAP
ncbi:MAG: EamA family transporter [Proteobacteria bacterium]|nr:EamA family transporter [Pseudomonadota bacterium]